MGFGAYIREKREAKGLTLAQVAGRLGVSIAYLSRIERDRENAPRDELIVQIADILGIPADEAFAEARRLPPDLQNRAREVIAAYRRFEKRKR